MKQLIWRMMTSFAFVATLSTGAAAQQSWVVDQKSSLAWWQVIPHMNYLWATSCPGEPSWRPGEPRGRRFHHLPWKIKPEAPPVHQAESAIDSAGGVSDTTDIPVYPRRRVRPVCAEALDGRVVVADTNARAGIRGQITVRVEAMITGDDVRDEYARDTVLKAGKYPEVKFTIDSVVRITQRADRVRGTAIGILTLRGVAKPIAASVSFWNDTTAGGMRVLAKMHISAQDLWRTFGIPTYALGIGAGTLEEVWMGVDLVMKPDGP